MLFFFISFIQARFFSLFPYDVNNPLSFHYGEGIYLDNIKGRFGFVHVNTDRFRIMVNGITLCPDYKKSIGICRGHEINDSWRIVRKKACLRISAILEHDGKINEYCWTFGKGNRRAYLKPCSGSKDQIFKLQGFDYTITSSKNIKLDEKENENQSFKIKSIDYPVVGINPESLSPIPVNEDAISETQNISNDGTKILCSGGNCARYRFRDLDSLGFKGNMPAAEKISYSLRTKRINNGKDNILIQRTDTILRRSNKKEGPPTLFYDPYINQNTDFSVKKTSIYRRRSTQDQNQLGTKTNSKNYQLMKPTFDPNDFNYSYGDNKNDFLNIFAPDETNPYLQHYDNTPFSSIFSPTYKMRRFNRITKTV